MLWQIRTLWDDFWWAPCDARSWGVIRILFYSLAFVFVARGMGIEWAQLDPILYRPVGFFSWMFFPPPTENLLKWVEIVWRFSVICAAIGLLTRLSAVLAFLSGFYFMSMKNSFGYAFHFELFPVLCLFLLCFVNSGTALSIDSFLKQKLIGQQASTELLPIWPLRLIQVLWVFVFFAAGVSKLRYSGYSWVFDGTLQYFLIESNIAFLIDLEGHPWQNAGLMLAQLPWACTLMAALALIWELTIPLVFLGGRWAQIYVLGFILFLAFVYFFMGIFFWALLPAIAFWIKDLRCPLFKFQMMINK